MRVRAKKSCIDCHFLAKEARNDTAHPHMWKSHLSDVERADARRDDYTWALFYKLVCHKGVWDEGYGHGLSPRRERLIETDRRGTCFFWRLRPGTFFATGEDLQARTLLTGRERRSRWVTAVSLLIAAASLAFTAQQACNLQPPAKKPAPDVVPTAVPPPTGGTQPPT